MSRNIMRYITAFLLFIHFPQSTWGAIYGGPVTNKTTGHRYYLLSPNTWAGAEAEAVTLGGHLATINDAAENDYVISLFARSGWPYWIGLNDAESEGEFRWVSGQALGFTAWGDGQPSDADYAASVQGVTNYWLTLPGEEIHPAFVEVVPETVGPIGLVGMMLSVLTPWGRRRRRKLSCRRAG